MKNSINKPNIEKNSFDKNDLPRISRTKRKYLKTALWTALCLALLCQNLFFSFSSAAFVHAETIERSNISGVDRKGKQEGGTKGTVLAQASVNVGEIAAKEAQNAVPQPIPPEQLRDRAKSAATRRVKADDAQSNGDLIPSDLSLPPGAKLLQKSKSDKTANFSSLVPSPSASANFQGIDDTQTLIPPDTMGAVGPAHVVTALNDRMRVHATGGTPINTFTTNSFWAPLQNTPGMPATLSTFDPKIYFDKASNRWIYVITANAQTATSAILLAVSQTSDPTGNWNLYGLDADSTDVNWADYPSVGFNQNWIVVTVNIFTNAANAFVRPDIYVFNKAQAVAGTTPLGFTKFTGVNTGAPFDVTGGTWAPSVDVANTSPNALWLVQAWNPTSGLLRVSKISGAVGSETIAAGMQFPGSTESWFSGQVLLNGGWAMQADDAGTATFSTQISANDNRIQNVIYRGGSLWAVHTVFEPNIHQPAGTNPNSIANPVNHSAIQWWQINATVETMNVSTPVQRGLIEDAASTNCHNGSGGIIGGCTRTGTNYAFPSIAVNNLNDVLIGFTRFNHLSWASSAYAYRDHNDPLNTFRDPVVYKAGEGRYSKSSGGNVRWGDYSTTVVDPISDRNFWTAQEYAAPRANAGATSVWSTWWARVNSLTAPTAASVQISGRVVNHRGNGLGRVSVTLLNTSTGERRNAQSRGDGTYLFEDVPVGNFYILSANRKRYSFAPETRSFNLVEELQDADFTAYPEGYVPAKQH